MGKGDKVYVIKTLKGEIINKLFESADKAMEYAKENGYLPCILITGEVQSIYFYHKYNGNNSRA